MERREGGELRVGAGGTVDELVTQYRNNVKGGSSVDAADNGEDGPDAAGDRRGAGDDADPAAASVGDDAAPTVDEAALRRHLRRARTLVECVAASLLARASAVAEEPEQGREGPTAVR